MTYIINFLTIFILFSFLGWCLEVGYRSYKNKYFINPGFLTGCSLPIYGFGGFSLYLICSLELNFITNNVLKIIIIILLGTILMTLIEFIAGLFCIKVYHNRLWDYSDRKFNILGIICPTFSIAWGLIVVFYYFCIMPWLPIFCNIVNEHISLILLLGMLCGLFLADLGYSMRIMDHIRHYAKQVKEVLNFERLKLEVKTKAEESKIKFKGLSFFKLRHHIISFINKKNDNEDDSDKE